MCELFIIITIIKEEIIIAGIYYDTKRSLLLPILKASDAAMQLQVTCCHVIEHTASFYKFLVINVTQMKLSRTTISRSFSLEIL